MSSVRITVPTQMPTIATKDFFSFPVSKSVLNSFQHPVKNSESTLQAPTNPRNATLMAINPATAKNRKEATKRAAWIMGGEVSDPETQRARLARLRLRHREAPRGKRTKPRPVGRVLGNNLPPSSNSRFSDGDRYRTDEIKLFRQPIEFSDQDKPGRLTNHAAGAPTFAFCHLDNSNDRIATNELNLGVPFGLEDVLFSILSVALCLDELRVHSVQKHFEDFHAANLNGNRLLSQVSYHPTFNTRMRTSQRLKRANLRSVSELNVES